MLTITLLILCMTTGSEEKTKEQLFGKWSIDEYKIEGKCYPIAKKDRQDYILFLENHRFESVSEGGTPEKGSWQINDEKKIIIFIDEHNQSATATIHELSDNLLVLEYNIPELKSLLFYYKKTN